MENVDWPCHSRQLRNPIDISNITKQHVLEFEKVDDDYLETFDADHDYDVEDIAKFTKLDMLECDGDTGSALDKYKRDMVPIPYGPAKVLDNRLMKRIKEKGFGETPTSASQVQVHYMYYTDLQEIPIDITYLRKKFPEKFRLGSSSLIPAFEYCVLSMKKGEKADFFASYELCFGELGCPPRIPPKADLYFEVHLIDFTAEVDLRSSAELESEVISDGYKEPVFKDVLQKAQELGASGRVAFNNKNTIGAIKLYRKAAMSLYNMKVDNHEDEMMQQETLCKMYRNLMVCYNEKKQFGQTCASARNAIQYAQVYASKDMKLFFLWGKALNHLQEWKPAMDKLKKALSLATKKSERSQIEKEIHEAEIKMNKYKQQEKQLCSRMFGSSISSDDSRTAYAEDEEVRPGTIKEIEDQDLANFEGLMKIHFGEFKMSDSTQREVLGVTNEFTREEMDILKRIASSMNLVLTVDVEVAITKRQ